MSDPDAMPDPIDAAYVEAEAVLNDAAARTARRQRVLAAVASDGAPDVRRAPAPPWRRGGWLVAASVAGLALVVASQLYRPIQVSPPRPPAPQAAVTATAAAPASTAMAQAAAPRGRAAAPASVGAEPAPTAFPSREETGAASEPAPANRTDVAAGGVISGESVSELVVTAEKRQTPTKSAPVAGSAFASAQRAVAAPRPADAAPPTVVGELVMASPDRGAQLRAAAADARTADVAALLKRGAPVDAADADGDTALMEAIRADHPATAALLRRHGASLERRNNAGQSAKDMARAVGDADLDKAIGLRP